MAKEVLHIQGAFWASNAQQPREGTDPDRAHGEAPWAHGPQSCCSQQSLGCSEQGTVRVGQECPGLADALCLSRCLAQMSVMVGLRLLHTSLESIANPEDPECESEGWVLENSLKDTFKSALENLKKLGKFNQVEAGAEGAEGEEGGKTPAITTVS